MFPTHDVQDVVSYLSGSDGALFGVRLQYLKHGLQLVQSAVLTLFADELSTHRLENTHTYTHPHHTFAFLTFFSFPPRLPLVLLTVH